MAGRHMATVAEVRDAQHRLAIYNEMIAAGTMTAGDWYGKAGQELFVLQRDEDALRSIHRGLGIDPSDAYSWVILGCALGEMERDEEALTAFDRALSLEPSLAGAQDGRQTALRHLGR